MDFHVGLSGTLPIEMDYFLDFAFFLAAFLTVVFFFVALAATFFGAAFWAVAFFAEVFLVGVFFLGAAFFLVEPPDALFDFLNALSQLSEYCSDEPTRTIDITLTSQ
ncbi:MAG: hypothetical protein KDA87_18115 [Planctomycetales bacterium]|nr:hypothetical protein [Planctomycetales bacterium]